MRIIILISSLILIFQSCNYKPNILDKDEIVIILKNAPNGDAMSLGGGAVGVGHRALLRWTDHVNLFKDYNAKKAIDTLVINIENNEEYFEVSHKYRGFRDVFFLLKVNDTIEFTYDENKYPFAKSFTSNKLTKQYNFQSDIKDRKLKNGFEISTVLQNYYYISAYKCKKSTPELFNSIWGDEWYLNLDSLRKVYPIYLKNFSQRLDSLNTIGEISPIYYKYYKYLLSLKQNVHITSDKKNSFKNETLKKSYMFFNDSLINRVSYRMRSLKLLKSIFINTEIRRIKSSNSKFGDYRQMFDILKVNTKIPKLTRNVFLHELMEQIIRNFTAEDIHTYLENYLEVTNETGRYNYLINRYNLFATEESLLINDLEGNKTDFKTMLEKHKGKLIYLDFWASWCAPCVRSMKSAKKLREKYRGKDVVFIYLAYNDKVDKWKSSVKKNKVDYLSECYFIENSKMSKFLVDIKLKTIPRYLLYDKEGKLIHKNAPGPGGDAIEELLNKYL